MGVENFSKCWGWGLFGRRLQSDTLVAAQLAYEDALTTGEILSGSPDLWLPLFEYLENSGVESRQDLEKLVFEETQEDTTIGLLEEVVLVSAIWEMLEEHVDTNHDGILSAAEFKAVDWSDVPLPKTPDAFKSVLTQDKVVKAVFADFLAASVSSGSGGIEEHSERSDDGEGMVPPS